MAAARNLPADGPSGAGRQVLIVDDDADCAGALAQLVAGWGYSSTTFNSFEPARAYLNAAVPDAAIVDVRLGKYNGFHLIHFIQQANPDAILIVVSGFEDSVLRREAATIGASFLSKPLKMAELRNALGVPAEA